MSTHVCVPGNGRACSGGHPDPTAAQMAAWRGAPTAGSMPPYPDQVTRLTAIMERRAAQRAAEGDRVRVAEVDPRHVKPETPERPAKPARTTRRTRGNRS